jgi:hypothetical protein
VRAGNPGNYQSNSKPAPNLGVVGQKRNIVHPDLAYEESELDIPPFLRKEQG